MVTEGMVCLAAMKVTGISSIHDMPAGCPDEGAHAHERSRFLTAVAQDVVEEIWPHIDQTVINQCVNGTFDGEPEEAKADDAFCICRPEEGTLRRKRSFQFNYCMHKLFKTLHGTITIDPVVLTENKKNHNKKKLQKSSQAWGCRKARGYQKLETVLVARRPMSTNSIVITVFDFR